jgi:hypothetical protein
MTRRLPHVRHTRKPSAVVPSTHGRLARRAVGSGLFLFLVIGMNSRGQREEDEQTNDLFHRNFSNAASATKRISKSKRIFMLPPAAVSRLPANFFD